MRPRVDVAVQLNDDIGISVRNLSAPLASRAQAPRSLLQELPRCVSTRLAPMKAPASIGPGRLLRAICALAAAASITGCGSSGPPGNGIASKPALEILAAAKRATDAARSVHIAGTVASEGLTLNLNLDMLEGEGAKGKISEGAISFEVVRIGNTAYIKGSEAFDERFGGREAAKLLNGKWLKAPATSGQLATLGALTDLRQLLDPVFAQRTNLRKGSITKIDGRDAIALSDVARSTTLYISTTGRPYPVAIEGANGSAASGTVTFSEWGAQVKLKAPAPSVSIGNLAHES